jgi:HEAT repeat protein
MSRTLRLWLLLGLAVTLGASAPSKAVGDDPPDKKAPIYKGKPVSAWVEALQSADPEVRSKAAIILGEMGAETHGLIPALIEALKNKDSRPTATSVLINQGRPIAPQLLEGLKHKDPVVRAEVASLLGTLNPPPAGVLAALERALKDDDVGVRLEAASSIQRMGGKDEVWTHLHKALNDKDRTIRERAIAELEVIPTIPIEGLKDLRELLGSTDADCADAP